MSPSNSHGNVTAVAIANRRVMLTPSGMLSPNNLTREKLVPYKAAAPIRRNLAFQTLLSASAALSFVSIRCSCDASSDSVAGESGGVVMGGLFVVSNVIFVVLRYHSIQLCEWNQIWYCWHQLVVTKGVNDQVKACFSRPCFPKRLDREARTQDRCNPQADGYCTLPL